VVWQKARIRKAACFFLYLSCGNARVVEWSFVGNSCENLIGEVKKDEKSFENETQHLVVREKNILYILWFSLLTNKRTSDNIYFAPARKSQAESCEIPI